MRSLSPATLAEIQQAVTKPVFLVELWLKEPTYAPVFLSTRETISYAGNTYQEAQVEFAGLRAGDNGEIRASVRLSPAYADSIIEYGIVENALIITALWGDGPWDPADGVPLFDGVVSDTSLDRDWVTITAVQKNSQGVVRPSVEYEHQNLLRPGTAVSIKGFTLVIEKDPDLD